MNELAQTYFKTELFGLKIDKYLFENILQLPHLKNKLIKKLLIKTEL
jgi:hypothetical protein